MAITKIREITQTVEKAIDYISNSDKTDDKVLINTFACSLSTAALEFKFANESAKNKSQNIARHIIQSFAPNEVTPEQAHEIGIKLADELLKGEYEYIIATHIDKGHIHNHIILNEVSFVTGKTFSTEHDRKKNPAWKQIRDISDKLCKEYSLSIVQNAERGTGKSYYEWEQSKNKTSWKDLLRENIDECIMQANSFDDFLRLMQEREYEYKRTEKTLSFRAKGQERFTRCRRKTLGWYYEPEQLLARIERSVRRRNAPVQSNNGFVQVRNPNQNNIGLQRWAMLKNMQELSEMINQLTAMNCSSPANLKEKMLSAHENRQAVSKKIQSIDGEIKQRNVLIKNIKTYWRFKPINDKYKTAFNKNKFYSAHESELQMFQTAKAELKKTIPGSSLPRAEALEDEIRKLNVEKESLNQEYATIKNDISSMEKLLNQLDTYMELQKEMPDRIKSGELE